MQSLHGPLLFRIAHITGEDGMPLQAEIVIAILVSEQGCGIGAEYRFTQLSALVQLVGDVACAAGGKVAAGKSLAVIVVAIQ